MRLEAPVFVRSWDGFSSQLLFRRKKKESFLNAGSYRRHGYGRLCNPTLANPFLASTFGLPILANPFSAKIRG